MASKRKYYPGYEHPSPGGMLTYLEQVVVNNSSGHFAKWKCYCGNIYTARVDYLVKKKNSCGCDYKIYKSGYEHQVPHGKLKYLAKIPTNNSRRHLAEWECFCGIVFKARLDHVIKGGYKSCGCKQYAKKNGLGFEKQIKSSKLIDPRITYLSNLYYGIKTRCSNPNDKYYGGRNIKMDLEWKNNKEKFIKDIISHLGYRPTETHQLDRINVNGNYTIENIRWATPEENSRNRRSNKLITIGNETKLLIEWSEVTGIKESVIRWRLRKNWPQEKLFKPIIPRKNKNFNGYNIKHILYGVVKRCYDINNDAFKYYGGRGIFVHEPWRNDNKLFEQEIINLLGPRPSLNHQLDRIDVNGNYVPGNLRWATSKENNNNKTNNFYIEYKGQKKTATELSEISGISSGIIKRRYLKGCLEKDLLLKTRK